MGISRGGSRTAATSKMERFVIIVNGVQPLTIITKRSILDVAAALDPPLISEGTEKEKIINSLAVDILRNPGIYSNKKDISNLKILET